MNAPCTAAVLTDGEPRATAAPDAAAPPGTDPLRHNRGCRSTIADLPPPVRARICREIRAGTPDSAIAAGLRERGYPISRSAIYRFRKSAADRLADWSAMRDAAALWSEGGADAALPEILRLAAFAIVARMDPAAPDSAGAAHAVARIARAIRDLAAAGTPSAQAAPETAAAAAPRAPARESVDDPRLPSLPSPGAPNPFDGPPSARRPDPPRAPRSPAMPRNDDRAPPGPGLPASAAPKPECETQPAPSRSGEAVPEPPAPATPDTGARPGPGGSPLCPATASRDRRRPPRHRLRRCAAPAPAKAPTRPVNEPIPIPLV